MEAMGEVGSVFAHSLNWSASRRPTSWPTADAAALAGANKLGDFDVDHDTLRCTGTKEKVPPFLAKEIHKK
jgi:hypothetical protein